MAQPRDPDDWFVLALVDGIEMTAKLSLIGKPDSPAAIELLADVFAEACWPGTRWDRDRDIPRIAEAFRQILKGVRVNPKDANRFPTPSDFMAALPIVEALQIEEKRGRMISMGSEEGRARYAAIKMRMAMTRDRERDEKLPDLSDKLACVNWSRRKRGLPEFADQAAWDEFAARAHARQDSALLRLEHE